MGILSRFKDIMSANLNSLADKAEDANAEKLLDEYLRKAVSSLDEVKAETASVMAQEKAAARKLNECQAEIEKFGNYVVAALKAGNDADAKKFLAYKNELETKYLGLQKEYVEAKGNAEKMRQMTTKLQNDIQLAKSKQQELKMQVLMAKQQENVNDMNRKLSINQIESFDSIAEKIQKRIDEAEARAELDKAAKPEEDDVQTLAAKYEYGATTAATIVEPVDDEIVRLKRELGLL